VLLILILPFVGALFVINMALSQLKSLPQSSQSVHAKSRLLELFFLSTVLASNSHNQTQDSGKQIDSVNTGGDSSD